MSPLLRPVTHLKLARQTDGRPLSTAVLDTVSYLLSPVAASCPVLKELSIDGDVGEAFLRNCSAMYLKQDSFVEVVKSLPVSISSQLTQLMCHVAMQTIMFGQGNQNALTAAVHRVMSLTTFDLYNRTLTCSQMMCFPQNSKVTRQNENVQVFKNQPAFQQVVFT